MDRVHRGGPWIGSTGVVHGSGPQVWSMEPGPVVQKPINANPRLKISQGVYFSTSKCCSTLIFGKTKISERNFHQKVENMKQKFTLILD